MARLLTLLRFAGRDLRRILFDYKVLVFSIAVGVTAVTGVRSLTDAFLGSLARDGRVLVGGDAGLSRAQTPLDADQMAWLRERGATTTLATLRAAIATPSGEVGAADIKAVEPNYPLVGTVRTEPPVAIASLDAEGRGALADPALLARVGLKVGDGLRVGAATFTIRAAIGEEPDRLTAGAALAPRVIVTRAGLDATGLLTPEALVRWTTRIALAPPASDAALDETVRGFKSRFPQAGVEVRSRADPSPQIARIIDRLGKFLMALSLLAVVVGGVGVWNAVALFVDRRRAPLAILKTLGASGAFVFGATMVEILALAALGMALGVALGLALPFAFQPFLHNLGVTGFAPVLSWPAIGGGAAVGFGAALLFSIPPAGLAHDVPGALLLRDAAGDAPPARLRLRYRLAFLLSFLLFIGAVGSSVGDVRIAAWIVCGAAALAILFAGAARLLPALIRALPTPGGVGALALGNLARGSRMTRAVFTSLGLSLIVLAATSLVTRSLSEQLRAGLPQSAPNLFLVGLSSRDVDAFRDVLRRAAPDAAVEEAPLMRGRIVEIKGEPAERAAASPDQAWVLEGDRGVTYSRTVPRDSTIAEGEWWGPDYDGPPLVSVGADAARGLGLRVGDSIAVNVAGRRVEARIANLRDINWASFGINFVLVFSPRPLAAAPHTVLFTVASRSLDDPARTAALVRDMAKAYPGVTAIDIHAMLEQGREMVEKAGLAVQASSIFALLAAAIVLAGAVAADGRARMRSATILKILGGARRQIVGAAALEWALLGLATGLFAIGAASAVAWAILHYLVGTPLVFAAAPLLVLLLGAVGAVVLFGLVVNWRGLNASPGHALRRI